MEIPPLKYFKLFENVRDPVYSTERSACFDIYTYIPASGIMVESWSAIFDADTGFQGEEQQTHLATSQYTIQPGERVKVPTGLIFDIPEGYSMRAHPRSGLAIKFGLNLPNCTGVIDEDYVEPCFIVLINHGKNPFILKDGERVCQAEMVKDLRCLLVPTDVRPAQKTTRNGGFGSTGNH